MMKQPYHDIENMKDLFIAMGNDIWNIDVENYKLLHKIADYLGQFCTTALLCFILTYQEVILFSE